MAEEVQLVVFKLKTGDLVCEYGVPITKVHEIMAKDPFTVHPDETIQECMEVMTNHRVRHLPVVENEKVIGMISIGDVVRSIIFQQKKVIQELEEKALKDKKKPEDLIAPERLAR